MTTPVGAAIPGSMRRWLQISVLAGLSLAAPFPSGSASAHIHLLEPQPRYPDEVSGENKNCPCGVGTAGRSCSKPEERSDPNRDPARATALTGGSRITVRLDEYVGHSGRYRIAFDPDGADLEDFNQHILADIPDPRGNAGNIGDGSLWEISAPLPNIDCDNCTLQVIQMMNGEMENPVADPVGKSTYYQCADLVLTQDPSKPEGYAEPLIVLGEPEEPEPPEMEEPPSDMLEDDMTNGPETASTNPPRDDELDPSSSDAVPSSADAGGGCSVSPLRGTGPARRERAWSLLAVAALASCAARRQIRWGQRSTARLGASSRARVSAVSR